MPSVHRKLAQRLAKRYVEIWQKKGELNARLWFDQFLTGDADRRDVQDAINELKGKPVG